MDKIMCAVTEWLDGVSIDWAENDDGRVWFSLDWGSSRYQCAFGVADATLVMGMFWHGNFAGSVEKAAPILMDMSALAGRGDVLINRQTGEVVFRAAVFIDDHDDFEREGGMDRLLKVAFDVFNVMIVATGYVVDGSMTHDQALETFAATLLTLFEERGEASAESSDDTRMADDDVLPGERLAPYWDDNGDPVLN